MNESTHATPSEQEETRRTKTKKKKPKKKPELAFIVKANRNHSQRVDKTESRGV